MTSTLKHVDTGAVRAGLAELGYSPDQRLYWKIRAEKKGLKRRINRKLEGTFNERGDLLVEENALGAAIYVSRDIRDNFSWVRIPNSVKWLAPRRKRPQPHRSVGKRRKRNKTDTAGAPSHNPFELPDSDASLFKFVDAITPEAVTEVAENDFLRGMFGPGEVGVMYGDSGVGKTFVALDLAMCLAQGRAWHETPTKRTPVLYISYEAQKKFDRRLLALQQQFGATDNWLVGVNLAPTLGKDDTGEHGARAIVEMWQRLSRITGEPRGMIVLDTLARAAQGADEDGVGPMMALIGGRIGSITEETGCAVLLIHHENKSGVIRGSTAIKAAADLLHIDRRTKDERTVEAEKVKDGFAGPLFGFRLRQVPVALAEDWSFITSAVVEKFDYVAKGPPNGAAGSDTEKFTRARGPKLLIEIFHKYAKASQNPAGLLALLTDVRSQFISKYSKERQTGKRKFNEAVADASVGLQRITHDGTEYLFEAGRAGPGH